MPYTNISISKRSSLIGRGSDAYLAAANDTLVLVVAKGAFVADSDECSGAHVAVANGTFAVAFIAEAADGYARLLAAHYEIAAQLSECMLRVTFQ